MSTGTTVQVIGAVVDVEFPAGQIPKVYDALVIDDVDVTLEVQQQLGDGVVRTIAMGSSEGLKRGMAVTDTGCRRIVIGVKAEDAGRGRRRFRASAGMADFARGGRLWPGVLLVAMEVNQARAETLADGGLGNEDR